MLLHLSIYLLKLWQKKIIEAQILNGSQIIIFLFIESIFYSCPEHSVTTGEGKLWYPGQNGRDQNIDSARFIQFTSIRLTRTRKTCHKPILSYWPICNTDKTQRTHLNNVIIRYVSFLWMARVTAQWGEGDWWNKFSKGEGNWIMIAMSSSVASHGIR